MPAEAAGEKVALLTPYLAAVATAEMVDSFKAEAEKMQWTVDVVDTAGDMPALASRVEDVIAAKVNAIVLFSVDPAQIQAQVDAAKAAGIPVVTIDGAKNGSTVLNVTSDNYVLGKTMTEFLFSAIGEDGKIVRFFHSAHPGVRQREIALDDALKANPGIKRGRRTTTSRSPARSRTAARRWTRSFSPIPATARSPASGRPGTSRASAPSSRSTRPTAAASSSPASTATRRRSS